MSPRFCAATLHPGSWYCLTAIQRGLKASGGDTAGPCISKYCSGLDPTGTIFQSPLVLLFVSFLLISPASRTSPLSAATQTKPARCVQASKDSITFINEHSKCFWLNFGLLINQNCSARLPLKKKNKPKTWIQELFTVANIPFHVGYVSTSGLKSFLRLHN